MDVEQKEDNEYTSSPDGLDECEKCGHEIDHDQRAIHADFVFNCHGGWMDDGGTSDGFYHHDCLFKVLGQKIRPGRRESLLEDE